SLPQIWQSSEAFEKFRGQSWMQEPCKTCHRREQDFGGCRCQAFLLAGDAAAADPVCSLAPQRYRVDAILATLNEATSVGAKLAPPEAEQLTKPAWLYRPNPA
ncbi:MAG TPA: hypothetical protein VIX91_13115, partial [Candidatus Acidoferrum sp.]